MRSPQRWRAARAKPSGSGALDGFSPRCWYCAGNSRRSASPAAGSRHEGGMDVGGIDVRKFVVGVEEIFHEGGPPTATPLKKGSIAAAIRNPFAGRHEPDILPLMDRLRPLGLEMSTRLARAIAGNDLKAIEGFGKGAIVGTAGELEHGALWHVP